MHSYPKNFIKWLLASSLKASSHERKEEELKGKLAQIVPDFYKQYSHFTVSMDDEYFVEKRNGKTGQTRNRVIGIRLIWISCVG